MPNQKETKYEKVKFVSAEDLGNKLDAIQGAQAKLEYAQMYILSYGLDEDDPELADEIDIESVLVAKNKIAEAALAENKNPTVQEADKVSLFLGDTMGYLTSVSKQISVNTDDNKLMRKSINGVTTLPAYRDALRDAENKQRNKSVTQKIEGKLPRGVDSIKDQLANCKGGFWERTFRTTSAEYKNFERELESYSKDDSKGTKNLESSSLAYIKHKFPNLKEGQLPTQEQINSLSGAGKDRTMLAVNTYRAIMESKNQPRIDNYTNNCKKYYSDCVAYQRKEYEKKVQEVENDVKQLGKEIEAANAANAQKEENIIVEAPKEDISFQNKLSEDVTEVNEDEMENLNVNEVSKSLEEDEMGMEQ